MIGHWMKDCTYEEDIDVSDFFQFLAHLSDVARILLGSFWIIQTRGVNEVDGMICKFLLN